MFSSDYYPRILSEVRGIRLGASLIIANVEDTTPYLIEINDEGQVMWQGDFVCIGTGGLLAWAMMSHLEVTSLTPLVDCSGAVYFAKKLAQKDPYVGTSTSLMVDIRGKKKTFISEEGQKYLDEHVKEISGPPKLNFDPKFLQRLEDVMEGDDDDD